MSTPGNHGAGSVASRFPLGAQTGHKASSSPPCSRTVPWPRHLFSPTNIPHLNGAGSFISEKELDIRTSIPTAAPLVHYKCQCSQSTPLDLNHQLHPAQSPTPTQPESIKLVPSSPLSQTAPTNPYPVSTTTHINPP